MTCTHQKEITELKRQHHQDLLDAVEAARRQHESLEMGIRDSYAQDREVSIEKERNAIRERYVRTHYSQCNTGIYVSISNIYVAFDFKSLYGYMSESVTNYSYYLKRV